MGLLVTFLFRNIKGLRSLVLLAMIITVLQVSCDIIAAFPLKFIPSKVQNVGNDPACLFPFLDPIESWFDIPQIDPSLQPDPHLRRECRHKRSARSTRTIRAAKLSWCSTASSV